MDLSRLNLRADWMMLGDVSVNPNFCIFHHPNPSIGLISACPSDIPGVVGRFGFVGCLGDLGSPGQPAAPAHDAT